MTIRKIPDIRFIIDESIEKSLKIEEILSKIKG
jgi:ribosome-binding factor A